MSHGGFTEAKGTTLLVLADEYKRAAESTTVHFRETLARELGKKVGSKLVAPDQQVELASILHLLLKDAEERVRLALAGAAATNPSIPPDIAKAIVNDADALAVPFLEVSDALTPTDLVSIVVACKNFCKMAAIARRKHVDCSVSAVLVTHGNVDVTVSLIRNPSAEISETSLHRVLEKFGDHLDVQFGLTERPDLPEVIAAKLIKRTSDDLVEQIIKRHRLPAKVAAEIALETRGRAAVGLCTGLSPDALEALIDSLITQNMVDEHFLVHSLSSGNLDLFCRCVAVMSRTSFDYVRRRVSENAEVSIADLWRSASLSEHVLTHVTAAIGVIVQSEMDCSNFDPATYRMRIIERILTQYNSMNIELDEVESELMFEIYEKSRHAHAHIR